MDLSQFRDTLNDMTPSEFWTFTRDVLGRTNIPARHYQAGGNEARLFLEDLFVYRLGNPTREYMMELIAEFSN